MGHPPASRFLRSLLCRLWTSTIRIAQSIAVTILNFSLILMMKVFTEQTQGYNSIFLVAIIRLVCIIPVYSKASIIIDVMRVLFRWWMCGKFLYLITLFVSIYEYHRVRIPARGGRGPADSPTSSQGGRSTLKGRGSPNDESKRATGY